MSQATLAIQFRVRPGEMTLLRKAARQNRAKLATWVRTVALCAAKNPTFQQQCPVCDGQGLVSRPPHIAGDQATWVDSGTGPYTCRRCGGVGTITAEAV